MKNLKRVLSLMMAVLLCFGLFPGSALAAENDYDGYLAMIEYKDRRYSLSENLPAPFGGHTTEEFFELRINDLRTYRTAYCIQMGVRANSGIGYESSDDYASFTEEQKALINTTLTLGYHSAISSNNTISGRLLNRIGIILLPSPLQTIIFVSPFVYKPASYFGNKP